MEAWSILLPAFVLSGIMVFSHAFFGLHVLARGIIFVDLALAQMAALGFSLAFLMGEEAHGLTAQLYAFASTLLAAFAFAGLRRIKSKINREVIIGCVYVVSTALSIIILSRSTQGMEELKSLFNGSILWVRWEEIIILAGVYCLLGLFHAVFHKRFYSLSFAENGKEQRQSFLWEFLFFATFAIIITFAVNVAGVLLVFAFLIIPAFSASLVLQSFTGRLLLAWGLGLIGALSGLWLSFYADLPVGATVVSVFGLLPVIAIGLRMLKK